MKKEEYLQIKSRSFFSGAMLDAKLVLEPTDVAYVATIIGLIAGGRKTVGAIEFANCAAPLRVLCFLGDRLQLQSIQQYPRVESFLTDLLISLTGISIGSVRQQSTVGDEFIGIIRVMLLNLRSIDDFIHFFDGIQDLFLNDSAGSPNEAMGPTKLCLDSSLGIYCRTLSAKWECLSFDLVCQLFESFTSFMGLHPNQEVIEAVRTVSLEEPVREGVHLFLQQAEEASKNGDVHTAEGLLHRYFDFNGNDPLLSVASKCTSGSSPQHALAALCHANDPQFTGTRHQQALLQLASMWSRNGHYHLAMVAVEEAMKTAHQRGDHGSVARALLLLYHVVSGLNSSDQKSSVIATVGAEEVLRRCLDRCSTLGMNALASQATVLLARLLSSRPLSWTQSSFTSDFFTPSEDDVDIQATDSRHSRSRSSVQRTWTLLHCSLLGDAKMCALLSSNESTHSTETAVTVPPTAAKELSAGLSYAEFLSIQAQCDIAAVHYWSRLGVPFLADLQCRRSLRTLNACKSAKISSELLISLSCQKATLTVQSAFQDLDDAIFADPTSSATRATWTGVDCARKQDACKAAMSILRLASSITASNSSGKSSSYSSHQMNNDIIVARVHIATLHSLISMHDDGFDFSKSLRLARHFVTLTSCDSSAMDGRSSVVSEYEGVSARFIVSATAHLLLARILLLADREEAQMLLQQLKESFENRRLFQQLGEAAALSAMSSICRCRLDNTHDTALNHNRNQNAILKLHQILATAKSRHYPVLEGLICKYVAIISTSIIYSTS